MPTRTNTAVNPSDSECTPETPLLLGTDLYYIYDSSNKYHRSILTGRYLLVKYGRRDYYGGQTGLKIYDTPEKAAAGYWGLVRSKIGKGYHVKDALTFDLSPSLYTAFHNPEPPSRAGMLRRNAADSIMNTFENLLAQRAAADIRRSRVEYGPGVGERSPRTPKQGKEVLLTLTQRNPDETSIIAAACAAESEEFLRYIALTHPVCPEEAEVAAALAIGDWNLL